MCDRFPLFFVSVISVTSVLKSPCSLTPTATLRSITPRNLPKKTPSKSVPCALFHFPYPVSPVFATLTKTAGCVPTIPILELAVHRSSLENDSSSFFSHSCALFCTFLHSPKIQPFYFHAIPHSLPKNTGGWGGIRMTSQRPTSEAPTSNHQDKKVDFLRPASSRSARRIS